MTESVHASACTACRVGLVAVLFIVTNRLDWQWFTMHALCLKFMGVLTARFLILKYNFYLMQCNWVPIIYAPYWYWYLKVRYWYRTCTGTVVLGPLVLVLVLVCWVLDTRLASRLCFAIPGSYVCAWETERERDRTWSHLACENDNNDDDDDADGDHDGHEDDQQKEVFVGGARRSTGGWTSDSVTEQTRRVLAAVVPQLDVVRPVLQHAQWGSVTSGPTTYCVASGATCCRFHIKSVTVRCRAMLCRGAPDIRCKRTFTLLQNDPT